MGKVHPSSLAISPSGVLAEAKLRLSPNENQSRIVSRGPSLLASIRLGISSDEDLVRCLQQGNADALTALFKRHNKLVFRIARKILGNDSEAEEATQQVFFDVFRAVHQFDAARGNFKTWLLVFAYHRTYNHRRSLLAQRYFETDGFDDLRPEQLQQANLHSQYSVSESRVLLDQALSQIQPRQRRTIELIHFEGLTAEEVSLRTGETVRVVRHNLYRGMDKLRVLLSASRNAQKTDDSRSGS